MSAPAYTQVPPADFQTIQTSYPPPPQHETKTFIDAHVQERGYSPNGLDEAIAPATGLRRFGFRLRSASHKFWLFEFAASVLSIILFGVILLVLKSADKKVYGASNGNPSERPTLFPILSILGTVMRAVMLLPVATAIAQLKWGWFHAERRLKDLERFDGAAHGILGSLKLLWTLRFRNIAVVGAALTILALPLDAIVQSSVRLAPGLVPNETPWPQYNNITNETTVPRSTSYSYGQVIDDTQKIWPRASMRNAIRFGYTYQNGLNQFLDARSWVVCPTGQCTFNKAQTLAIGSQCMDRTADIQTNRVNGNLPYQTLPGADYNEMQYNGTVVNGTVYEGQFFGSRSYTNWPESYDGYSNQFDETIGPLLIRTSMMMNFPLAGGGSEEERASQTVAYECALYWYILTTEEYVNSTESFDLQARNSPTPLYEDSFRYRGEDNDDPPNWWVLEPKQCYVEGKEIPKDDSAFYFENCIFKVGEMGGTGLNTMLFDNTNEGEGFLGQVWVQNALRREWVRTNAFSQQMFALMMDSEGTAYISPDVLRSKVAKTWGTLSWSLTWGVRNARSMTQDVDENSEYIQQSLYTTGTVDRDVLIWSIDWPRLGAPAFVVGFSALFVLITAMVTRKQYLWKRSSLPLLFHGLGERERVAVGNVTSYVDMVNIADKLRVRLDPRAGMNGARFTSSQ